MAAPKCRECEFHIQRSEGFPHHCYHPEVWKPVNTQKCAYIPSKDMKPSPCWCPIRLKTDDKN